MTRALEEDTQRTDDGNRLSAKGKVCFVHMQLETKNTRESQEDGMHDMVPRMLPWAQINYSKIVPKWLSCFPDFLVPKWLFDYLPGWKLRLKVEYCRTKPSQSINHSTTQLPGAFWSGCLFQFKESYYSVKSQRALILPKLETRTIMLGQKEYQTEHLCAQSELNNFDNNKCHIGIHQIIMSQGHFTHAVESPWHHYTSSTLIGGRGGASPSSLHTMLQGPMEYVNDARWM